MKTKTNKSPLSPLVVRGLRYIKRLILSEPRRFQMAEFEVELPRCGTACCILGHARHIPDNAARMATQGFLYTQTDVISFNCWPHQFRRAHKEGTAAFARQGSRRIDHLIATGR